MFDHDMLYNVLDSLFVSHLVRDGENDASSDNDNEGDTGTAIAPASMPENMLDDLIDELDETLTEIHEDFSDSPQALTACARGYMDGVLAQSNGSYTSYEDTYAADLRNARFASIDKDIARFAEEFDGNRDWSEAALGYLRHLTAASEGRNKGEREDEGQNGSADRAVTERGSKDQDNRDNSISEHVLPAQAIGFIYGADTAQDYEWKVLQDPNGNIVVTDEEAIDEFQQQQLASQGKGGNLFDRMFNALGIDLGELEAALGSTFDEEGAADSDPNNDSTTSR